MTYLAEYTVLQRQVKVLEEKLILLEDKVINSFVTSDKNILKC